MSEKFKGGDWMVKLTTKQKAFADNYIRMGNAVEAAKQAGYSERTAKTIGTENLTKPHILEYIKEHAAGDEHRRIASGDEVLQFFTRVMKGEEKDASLSNRMAAGKEILRRNVDDRKLEIELMKLESQIKDIQSQEDKKDNFLDALNASAREVWEDSEEPENEE